MRSLMKSSIKKKKIKYLFVVEGKDGGKWSDRLSDVIVHVFSASERAFYNLEKLWSDAPLVDLNEWVVA